MTTIDLTAAIEAGAWALIDSDTDVVDRGVSEDHYGQRLDDAKIALTAALPHIERQIRGRHGVITDSDGEEALTLGALVLLADGIPAQLDAYSGQMYKARHGGRFWRRTDSTFVDSPLPDRLLPARVLYDPMERVKPSREDLLRALALADGQALPGFDLGHTAEVMYGKQADAILALLPGKSEAEVKAEALREAADELTPGEDKVDDWGIQAGLLRDRADAIERGGSDG